MRFLPPYLASAAICLLRISDLQAGNEFQINQTTPLDQRRAAIAQLTGGSVVAVWENRANGAGEIWRRAFSADGTPAGPESVVFGDTGKDQTDASVTGLADGGFVVAWSRKGGDSDNYSVAFQRFDSAGTPVDASPVQANVTEAGPQFHPQVASLVNGGFVITWVAQNGNADQDVFYRRVGADGKFLDDMETAANSLGNNPVTDGEQGGARVAGLDDGGFIIVYEDRESSRVYGVRFDATGLAVTGPDLPPGNKQFAINQGTDFEYSAPAVVGLPNGAFAVAMDVERAGVASSRQVHARIFGSTTGDEFSVGSNAGRRERPALAGLPGGEFVVAWQTTGEGVDAPTGAFSVWAQLFGSDGTPKNPAFMMNQYNDSHQRQASLAPVTGGGFAAAWQSFGQDGSGYGVFGGVFPGDAAIPGKLFITLEGTASQPRFNVTFVGMAGRTHELQGSPDFTHWTPLLTISPADGKFGYLDGGELNIFRFYRVITQ